MKPEAKERIYLLVIIFSLLMCSAMIVTMLSGEKPEIADRHVPVVRNIKDTGNMQTENEASDDGIQSETDLTEGEKKTDAALNVGGQISVTEDYINDKLEDFLPSGFPLKNGFADISNSMLSLKGETHTEELIQYLRSKDKNGGLSKYSAVLMFLPEKMDIEVVFAVQKGTSGKNELKIHKLVLADREIGVDLLPASMLESLSKAVVKAISNIGEGYEFSSLENGAVILNKI